MNNIMIFNNLELGNKVRTIENDDGSISINAEDTAIGFGWIKTENKNGKQYTSVRWERMNSFINELDFRPQVGEGDFIPESLFYLLGMKASNKMAKEFQKWLAIEVIPQIRKTGLYVAEKYKKIIDKQQEQIKRLELCVGINDRYTKMYSRYIKNKLGIIRIDKDYEVIKNNVFSNFGVERWEQLSMIDSEKIFACIDKCVEIIDNYKQLRFAE